MAALEESSIAPITEQRILTLLLVVQTAWIGGLVLGLVILLRWLV